MKTLTRNEICEAVKSETGLPHAEAGRLLDDTFDTIAETLGQGEEVKIARFGVFLLHRKKERVGRNLKTGERVVISERYSVSFRASEILRERIRKGGIA